MNKRKRTSRSIARQRLIRGMMTEMRRAHSAEKIAQIAIAVAHRLGGLDLLVSEWTRYFGAELTPTQKLRMLDTLVFVLAIADQARIQRHDAEQSFHVQKSDCDYSRLSDDELLNILAEPIRNLRKDGLLEDVLSWMQRRGELSLAELSRCC